MSKTFAVSMLQESGHLNPVFKIARTLKARGHRVVFFSIPEHAERIAGRGFETMPWFADLHDSDVHAPNKANTLSNRRTITARYHEMAARLLDDRGPAAELRALRPDLLLVDVTLPLMAFTGLRLRLPLLYVHTSLPQTKDFGVPPLRSSMTFGDGLRRKLRAEASWRAFLAKRRLGALAVTGAGMCPPYALTRRFADRFGVRPADLDPATVYMPQVRHVPEVVLCPPDFDFPRPAKLQRQYAESVDLERDEVEFPWDRLDDRPLVYASLGSQLYAAREARLFLQRLVEAFRQRPQWQLVLSLGRHCSATDFKLCPKNVVLVQTAPQLALLKRARAMVTHGGLGSVKECILNAVPMVVFPLDVDQPGNAARVRYHGLGESGDVGRTSLRQLMCLLDRVMLDDSFVRRTEAMKDRFERVEMANHGAAFIERHARREVK